MELSVSLVVLSLVEPSPVAGLFSAAVVLLLFFLKTFIFNNKKHCIVFAK